MEFATVLRSRRSIRNYKSDPVPPEVIRDLLDQARWTPSWANSQCWQAYVVTGQTLERLREVQRQAESEQRATRPDFRMPNQKWPEPLQEHRQTLLRALTGLRPATPKGGSGSGSAHDFFGAPCLIFLTVDRTLVPDYACFDTGLFVQSLCLAAHDRGLGTCILAMAVRHPDLLRKVLPGGTGKAFVIGVALGYPELDAPINGFERSRAELDEFVTWAG